MFDDPLPHPALAHQHQLYFEVQIYDTDCFGVMWHGSYTKWLETGRIAYLKDLDIRLSRPEEADGYVYPVAEQQFRYKSPARYGDSLVLTTRLTLDGYKLYFDQTIANAESEKLVLIARTLNLIVDMSWKLQRRLPADLQDKLAAVKP